MKSIRDLCREKPFFDACVYDCLSAKIVENAGFPSMCLSGAAVSMAYGGYPDFGVMTATETAEMTRRIARNANIPLIVDIDSGYGNELNIIRTCEMVAAAGASAVHLEDQSFPKRTPTMSGFSLVSRDTWKRMIEAAMHGLRGTDCMLIARSDSRVSEDAAEAIARLKDATDLGAEMTLAIGMYDEAEIRDYMEQVPGYKMYEYLNMPGVLGTTKEQMSRTFDDCVSLGYTMMSLPTIGLFGAIYGIKKYADSVIENKHDFDIIRNMEETGTSFPYFRELTERERLLNWDRKNG